MGRSRIWFKSISSGKMSIVNYFYYKFYKFTLQSSVYGTTAPFAACAMLTIFSYFNFGTLLSLYYFYKGIPIPKDPLFIFVVPNIVILTILCLIYLPYKRYEKIVGHFSKENKRSRITGNIIVLLYVIGSVITFLVVSFLRGYG